MSTERKRFRIVRSDMSTTGRLANPNPDGKSPIRIIPSDMSDEGRDIRRLDEPIIVFNPKRRRPDS